MNDEESEEEEDPYFNNTKGTSQSKLSRHEDPNKTNNNINNS
jgi:hypothetical protein